MASSLVSFVSEHGLPSPGPGVPGLPFPGPGVPGLPPPGAGGSALLPVQLAPVLHAQPGQLAAVVRPCRPVSRDAATVNAEEYPLRKRKARTQLTHQIKKKMIKLADKQFGGIDKPKPNPKLEYSTDIKDVSDKVSKERVIKIEKLDKLSEKFNEIMKDTYEDTTNSFNTWIEDEKTKIEETIKNEAKNKSEKMKNEKERRQKKAENLNVLKYMFDKSPSLAILFEELLVEKNWKIPQYVKKENFREYFKTIKQQYKKVLGKRKAKMTWQNDQVLKTKLDRKKEQEKQYEEWKNKTIGNLCKGRLCSEKSKEERGEICEVFSVCPNCHYAELYDKQFKEHCRKWEEESISKDVNIEKQNDLISLLYIYTDDMRRYIVEQDKVLRTTLFQLECKKAMLHDSLQKIEANQFEIDEDWKELNLSRHKYEETISNLKSQIDLFVAAAPPHPVLPPPARPLPPQ